MEQYDQIGARLDRLPLARFHYRIFGIISFSLLLTVNRPGFPGECFICELRLPDHRFGWNHYKLFLLLQEEYGPAFP
ncbi:hypothetical protein, partial [Escherichia coli]|uniref:hypothetical protein n=8 Tax=Escherichia coli TaxID=562 RepID=UPI00201AA24C